MVAPNPKRRRKGGEEGEAAKERVIKAGVKVRRITRGRKRGAQEEKKAPAATHGKNPPHPLLPASPPFSLVSFRSSSSSRAFVNT